MLLISIETENLKYILDLKISSTVLKSTKRIQVPPFYKFLNLSWPGLYCI
jgi:hypothetical protein